MPQPQDLANQLAALLPNADPEHLLTEVRKYQDYAVPDDQILKTVLRHHGYDPKLQPRPKKDRVQRTWTITLTCKPDDPGLHEMHDALVKAVRYYGIATTPTTIAHEDKAV